MTSEGHLGELLDASDLAARWKVAESHIYALTRRGEIPVVKLGRYYRYRLDQIEAFELGEFTSTKEKAA